MDEEWKTLSHNGVLGIWLAPDGATICQILQESEDADSLRVVLIVGPGSIWMRDKLQKEMAEQDEQTILTIPQPFMDKLCMTKLWPEMEMDES